ncbi:hypothetical protein H113_01309 [Trichophyton rubrum MR1459]|nr:hypothetical protein H102_01298 [Trichophyton rubrum CBS 100081]EZF98930.1 hypothetical protein H113_01309 [Trichophyton rubrum MR1459]EZG20544.1 hypothetical protein H107_01356 [Trichophyton rubrum CBS 202.88]
MVRMRSDGQRTIDSGSLSRAGSWLACSPESSCCSQAGRPARRLRAGSLALGRAERRQKGDAAQAGQGRAGQGMASPGCEAAQCRPELAQTPVCPSGETWLARRLVCSSARLPVCQASLRAVGPSVGRRWEQKGVGSLKV